MGELKANRIYARARQIGFSIADQGFAVGGVFLVNVALARAQSKEQYGIFALSYSVFTFLSGLHNAAVLEAYTVFGSGRHHRHFRAYADKFVRINFLLCAGLALAVVFVWRLLAWKWTVLASRTVLGMAIACGFLLAAAFVRRTFYIRRRPDLAAKFSFVFFLTCLALLAVCVRTGILNGFNAFLTVAVAWVIAGLAVLPELPRGTAAEEFLRFEPSYWTEHWRYSRWVLATAFVFQFTWQGYYWLSAALLSVKEVADLRAMYNLVSPVDQVFIAMSFLVIPWMSHRYSIRQMSGLLPAWRIYCAGVIALTVCFAVLVNIVGTRAMHIFYAGKFDDIAALIGILAFLPTIMGIGNTMNDALKSAERPKFVFYAYVCSGAMTFLVGIPLVIHFGLRGAVYGMLSTAATYTVALAVILSLNSRNASPAAVPIEAHRPELPSSSTAKLDVA